MKAAARRACTNWSSVRLGSVFLTGNWAGRPWCRCFWHFRTLSLLLEFPSSEIQWDKSEYINFKSWPPT